MIRIYFFYQLKMLRNAVRNMSLSEGLSWLAGAFLVMLMCGIFSKVIFEQPDVLLDLLNKGGLQMLGKVLTLLFHTLFLVVFAVTMGEKIGSMFRETEEKFLFEWTFVHLGSSCQ